MGYSQKLSPVTSAVAGDYLSLFSLSEGDWRGAPMSVVQAYMQANLTFSTETALTKQAVAPVTGATVTVLDGSVGVWLIVRPAGTIATLTIKLPSVTNATDRQEVLVNCTQIVTTLTVDGNGATAVVGEPAALTADGFFRMKYDAGLSTWYRVG